MRKFLQPFANYGLGARIAGTFLVLNGLVFGLLLSVRGYLDSNITAGVVFFIALLVVAAIQYVYIRSSISQPLDLAAQAAGKFAAGDLTTRIETSRSDEIGNLLKAIDGIGGGLANVVWHIRRGTETLADATSRIATGNGDLSQRTEQQAAALDVTTASMEQMMVTVRDYAGNASQAVELARAASEVAIRGGSVVGNVVHTMDAINQSSKKIVDIISVINSIAFQTNILALNAAVEAARAGEQGRGFAVVATEVRSLAQRSATAAQEIKTLIDSSVVSVQNGSQMVAQAGTTMKEVVDSIKRVNDTIDQITQASREQSTGIEQVNQAMAQIGQGTHQNAAIVKQAAAAAEALKTQTLELNKIVGIFKIKSAQHGSRDEAVELVGRAVTSLTQRGCEPTFSEINNPLGRFCDRDLYVVVYDLNGKNLAHGAHAANVGKEMINAKDGAGKLFIQERVAIIRDQGGGWQDYVFLNPISKQMEAKSMFLARHEDLIVGCGAYQG